jgi:hypothetical protein
MTWLVLALAACAASLLSFFSGFGLGTILTPVFAVFFPVEIAIALTGGVHLLNNLFKLGLTYRDIHLPVLWRFGLPSVIGAFAGAWLLLRMGEARALYAYDLGSYHCEITLLKLVVSVLMIVFTLVEFMPSFKHLEAGRSRLLAGGALSGFFGGLSGHQGALRSVFLARAGLSKEAFIATTTVIACFVDLTRLPLYYARIQNSITQDGWIVLGIASAAGFIGAFAGSKLLKKVTLELVQKIVAVMIVLLAVALGGGLI